METLQYYVNVIDGKVEKEEGVFFKGIPFSIIQNGVKTTCVFMRNEHKHVVYRVSQNGTHVTDLEHPDYLPELTQVDRAVIEALDHVTVAKRKEVSLALDSQERITSFEIKQPFYKANA